MRDQQAQIAGQQGRTGMSLGLLADADRAAFRNRRIKSGPFGNVTGPARAVGIGQQIMRPRAIARQHCQPISDPPRQFVRAAAGVNIDQPGQIDIHPIAQGSGDGFVDRPVGHPPQAAQQRGRQRGRKHRDAQEDRPAHCQAARPSSRR